jgi:hypothetical protein
LFLREQQRAVAVGEARALVLVLERLPVQRPPSAQRLLNWRRMPLAGWKQVGSRRVRSLELQQAVKLPALDPMTSCIRRRAILPTARWSPEIAFDDS